MVQSRQGLWFRQSRSATSQDVFVHMETVRNSDLGDLQPGHGCGANRGGQEGPDRGRTALGIAGRVAAAMADRRCRRLRLRQPRAAGALGALRRRARAGAADDRIVAADASLHRRSRARRPKQQARGLMYRQSLAPDRGMIFPYDPPGDASFWMKNTLIPLDMIFIRPGRDDRADRREHRADVARSGSVARAGRGGARDRRRPLGRARHQGRRQGQLAH